MCISQDLNLNISKLCSECLKTEEHWEGNKYDIHLLKLSIHLNMYVVYIGTDSIISKPQNIISIHLLCYPSDNLQIISIHLIQRMCNPCLWYQFHPRYIVHHHHIYLSNILYLIYPSNIYYLYLPIYKLIHLIYIIHDPIHPSYIYYYYLPKLISIH